MSRAWGDSRGQAAVSVAMTVRLKRCLVRPGPTRIHLVVVGAFLVAAIATLTKIPQVLQAAKPEAVSASKRALAPATFYRLDAQVLVRAAQEIPRDATYAVVGGDRVPSRFVRIAERTLLAYWLLPRRRTDVHSSDWIVSIGADLQSLGLRYARVVRVGQGSELAEVRR
jgi:hypothetical protein